MTPTATEEISLEVLSLGVGASDGKLHMLAL